MKFTHAVLVIFDKEATKRNPGWKTKYFYFCSKKEGECFRRDISSIAIYLGIKEIKEVQPI